ncbi:MAG: hypothetical protein LQ352_008355 [Teloschistes flavicans]|nr:MAG: hypothetical protein LQ352_008355 [Teloschistes flavicans]
MPTVGTAKHFYCVNVLEFDQPAVIYEKADCTGKSCFIPGAGNYVTWSRGAQANCIEIDPQLPVNVSPCLSAGQNGLYPPNGGFPSGVPEPVGGDYGLPAAYANSQTCSPVPDNVWPGPIPRDPYTPPAGDINQQYQSGITDTPGLDHDLLDKRSPLRPKLWARVQPIIPITTTGPLRNVQQVWWYIGAGGVLQSIKIQYNEDDMRRLALNIDHVVELNMIINFLSQAYDASTGITQNQWTTVQDFIKNAGRRNPPAPNGDTYVS